MTSEDTKTEEVAQPSATPEAVVTRKVIRVLKPFMFTFPAKATEKLTTERLFTIGDHEIDDEIANHPWIKAGADGKIESVAQARARHAKALAAVLSAEEEARVAADSANAAMARIQSSQPENKASAEEIERELNTPVHEIKKRQAPLGVAKKV